MCTDATDQAIAKRGDQTSLSKRLTKGRRTGPWAHTEVGANSRQVAGPPQFWRFHTGKPTGGHHATKPQPHRVLHSRGRLDQARSRLCHPHRYTERRSRRTSCAPDGSVETPIKNSHRKASALAVSRPIARVHLCHVRVTARESWVLQIRGGNQHGHLSKKLTMPRPGWYQPLRCSKCLLRDPRPWHHGPEVAGRPYQKHVPECGGPCTFAETGANLSSQGRLSIKNHHHSQRQKRDRNMAIASAKAGRAEAQEQTSVLLSKTVTFAGLGMTSMPIRDSGAQYRCACLSKTPPIKTSLPRDTSRHLSQRVTIPVSGPAGR